MNLKKAPHLSTSSDIPDFAKDVGATQSTLTSAPSVCPSGKLSLWSPEWASDPLHYCRYCSQKCLTQDWKYHSHRCRKPQKDSNTTLGSRRLKGQKKQDHCRDCDILLAKLDPVLGSVLFDGFLRTYCNYEDNDRCLRYKPDKIRLDRVAQTLSLCERCENPSCETDCGSSCVLM